MIRKMVSLCVAAAALTSASAAFAFEPISYSDVPDLIGKQVFAAENVAIQPSTWVYAGDTLTVVSAEPYAMGANTTTYNYVHVKTEDGKEGDIQIGRLSKAPLRFKLRDPGLSRQLVLAVFADALELPARMHEIQSKSHYELNHATQADEEHLVSSMAEAFKFERGLIHCLVYGTHEAKDSLLRRDETKWVAATSDDSILDWYSEGIKDKSLKAKLVNAVDALNALDNVSSFGFQIARLERERTRKAWRDGLDDLPAAKLEKLDAEKLAKIDGEMQELQKKIKTAFAKSATLKARVR